MKRLKTLSFFRIGLLLLINCLYPNIALFIISIVYLFFINKYELYSFIGLFVVYFLIMNYLNDFLPYGIIDEKNSNYIVVDKILYKTKIFTKLGDIGNIVKYDVELSEINKDTNLIYNVKYINKGEIEVLFNKTLYNISYNRALSLDDNIKNLCLKVLFNSYKVNNEIDLFLGYGLNIYYLLRIIFRKNKYISLIALIIYSVFFGFKVKLILIIFDFILSYIDFSNLEKLGIKLILISLINPALIKNYSFLITTIYSFINLLKLNDSFVLSILQSYLFGYINLFISYFYKYYVYFLISIFCMTLFIFILPNLYTLPLFIIENLSSIVKLLSISIRGKISILSLIIVIIVSLLLKNKYLKQLILIICLLSPINNPIKHITFIDIRQGDSVLIKDSIKGYNVLIDTGSVFNYSKLKKQLFNEGVYTIDYLILTHDDSDHNGCKEKIKEDFKIKNIIEKPIDINIKDLFLDNINVGKYDNDNDNSLVYLTNIDNYKILFTGDISKNVESKLIEEGLLPKIDILKVSHHGSKTATTRAFLSKTLPDYAIISTNGQYGHPSSEVIKNLELFKVNTYITKDSGNIVFYFTDILDFIKTRNFNFDIIIS